jgi:hypothetical protein
MEIDTKELVKTLTQPHRVANIMALFKFCEQAATVIQEQQMQIEKLKSQPPAPAEKPKRARKASGQLKADDPSTPDVNEAWVGGKAPKKS